MIEATLTIHLVPGSRKTQIVGYDMDGILKVKVTQPALDGRANRALIKYLSELLNIPISTIYLKHGEKSRRKVVGILALNQTDTEQRIHDHISK